MLKKIHVKDAVGKPLSHDITEIRPAMRCSPACGLHHRTTVLDLILPRLLAGEHIGKKELAFLGHGMLNP